MFAQTYKNYTIQQWGSALWSDKSKCNLHGSDGRHYVRRPTGEKFNPRYTRGTVKHGSGNVMLWRCFSSQGVGSIKCIKEVYNNIISTTRLPYADIEMPPLWTFQHDNDPKHTYHAVKSWLDENQVNIMPGP